MRECSFKPKINPKNKALDSKSKIQNIKGLESYLENVDKQQRIKQNLKLKQD